jgi:hypothetical protein
MRNWMIPVTVLGLSGLGLLCVSDRGREQMRALFESASRHGDPLGEFLECQLLAMQRTLDDLARALEEQSA